LVSDTELSAKNTIKGIGSLSVAVLKYNCGITNWNQEELRILDRKIRKQLSIHGGEYPETDIDRLYVPRRQGKRAVGVRKGLLCIVTNLID
jgi:hypothetical protein